MPTIPRTLTAAGIAFAILTGAAASGAQPIPNTVTFRNFFKSGTDSLAFARPVGILAYPGIDSQYVVLQQGGALVTVRRLGNAWMKTDSAVFAVSGGTGTGYYEERGLLGFAFHPQWASNRKYYVCYFVGNNSVPRRTVIAEHTADVTGRPRTGDSRRTILTIPQTADNHNGGTLAFGPDGYLYHATGDGGNSPDPNNYAQNRNDLRGKVLRIDVDGPDAFPADTARNYAIPADNPFVGQPSVQAEVWAYGFRNPWKFSFHPENGSLWLGDVGLTTREEINRVAKGGNYGWRAWEGTSCREGSTACNALPGTIPPALELPYGNAARSITGGAFFTAAPGSAHQGLYIFGDYISNRVWAMRIADSVAADTAQIGTVNNVVSFDRDNQGRILATSVGAGANSVVQNSGAIFLLESPDMTPPVSLRGNRAIATGRAIRLSDLRRHPERYEILRLDGTRARGIPAGTFLVRERGNPAASRLMSGIH